MHLFLFFSLQSLPGWAFFFYLCLRREMQRWGEKKSEDAISSSEQITPGVDTFVEKCTEKREREGRLSPTARVSYTTKYLK